MVQTAQNPYEREKFNTQDEFIQQGQDMTTSLAGSSAPQATPLTSTGASATTDILPPPTEIQKTPTEKYAAPPGGQISYEGYNPATVQGAYAKYFNPLTSKLGESSTALGTAVSGFNTAAGLPRTWESVGGQNIFSGIEQNPTIQNLTGTREVQTSPATPPTEKPPGVIQKIFGKIYDVPAPPVIEPGTPAQYGTETRQFRYPEYNYSTATPLAEAAYTGPAGLDQAALDSILRNIGGLSAFMNPSGAQTDLTSGFGAQELLKLGTSGLTPGELRFSAKDLIQSPEYRNAATQTQKDLVKLYQDFLRTQGEATAIGESRTTQEKSISEEAKKRIAALEAQAAAQKDLALYALSEYQAGRGGGDYYPPGYTPAENQPNPDEYKVLKKTGVRYY